MVWINKIISRIRSFIDPVIGAAYNIGSPFLLGGKQQRNQLLGGKKNEKNNRNLQQKRWSR